MSRFCLGPVCRDLKPLSLHPRYGGNTRYCLECRREVRRRTHAQASRTYRKRHAAKVAAYARRPDRREAARVSSLAWYHRNKGKAA